MRIPWTRLALVAAACLSGAVSARAANFDPTNHTTRLIALLSEDHPCTNKVQGPPTPADPGCLIFANDPTAVYTDPSNDYFATASYVGVSGATGGTNTFHIQVSQAVWAKVLQTVLSTSGATLTSNTTFDVLFDATTGVVVPNPPNTYFFQANATFAGNLIIVTGRPSPNDYPFFGTSSTPGGTQFSGPPLVFSCGWDTGVYPVPIAPRSTLGPAGYLTTPYPMTSPPCAALIPQPGFALVPPLTHTAMTFFEYSTVVLSSSPGTAFADSVFTAYKWKLQETVDTDGDGIPDPFDNCPYMPNGPLIGTCLGTFPQGQAICHSNGDCTSGVCSLNQEDTGGVGVGSPPDGIGDACQCGDINNDGLVTSIDATILKRSTLHLTPYTSVTLMPGYLKCDVNANGTCDSVDASIISRSTLVLPPGITQGCTAAKPH